jgi:hypothetical protein
MLIRSTAFGNGTIDRACGNVRLPRGAATPTILMGVVWVRSILILDRVWGGVRLPRGAATPTI